MKIDKNDIDEISAQFKALKIDNDFRLVSGDDIAYWYLENNSVNKSTIGESCMKEKKHQKHLWIYNALKLKMLVLIENEKCVGRALIWETNEGITFMDRIYYATEWIKHSFIDEAIKRGWQYKKRQSYSIGTEEDVPDMSISFKLPDYNNYPFTLPYMDTFIYYYETEGWSGFKTKWTRPKTEDDILYQVQHEDGTFNIDWATTDFRGKLLWSSRTRKIGSLVVENGYLVNTRDGILTMPENTIDRNLIYKPETEMKISEFCKKYTPYNDIENGYIILNHPLDLRKIEINFIWDMLINLNGQPIYLDAEIHDLTDIRFKNVINNIFIKNRDLAPEKLQTAQICY
jgi:hypothetical protein